MNSLALREAVLDQLGAAADLDVRTVDANGDAVKYQVTMSVTLSREAYDALGETAKRRGTKMSSELRSMIRRGLRDCLAAADDDGQLADGVADRVAARYGE